MNRYTVLIARWLMWTLVTSFESVVGFPWLSIFVAGEWVLADTDMTFASILFMATVVAATYGLTLAAAVIGLLVVWRTVVSTRKNSLSRWGVFGALALAIGVLADVPLSSLTVSMTVLELLLLFRFIKGNVFRTSWQKIKHIPSSEM